MPEETQKQGQATTEQVDAWKAKYGVVFAYTADDKICYLRKPDRMTLNYASRLQNDPLKSNELLIKNCWLGGWDGFKTEDEYFFGLNNKLKEIIQVKQGELAKL